MFELVQTEASGTCPDRSLSRPTRLGVWIILEGSALWAYINANFQWKLYPDPDHANIIHLFQISFPLFK
jgi:hypothetical protein